MSSPDTALEWTVGMQAQAPLAPYVGLWSRLEGLGHDELARLTDDRLSLKPRRAANG